MKKPFRYTVFAVMLTPTVAVSQDFDAGVAAYEAGDYAKALREWRPLAEQGNAAAQSALGILHYLGLGVTQDYSKAELWYRQAAKQDYAEGQHYLGNMYYFGQGVTQDYTEAARWYRRAAEQGYALGQYSYGLVYYNGQGVTEDQAEAARWFRRSAEQGYAPAQNNLGHMYSEGEGVPKDEVTGLMWFNIATIFMSGDERSVVFENRDEVLDQVTNDEEAEAWRRASKCVDSNFRECDFPLSQIPSERGNDEPISFSKGPSAEQIAGAEARDLAYRMRIAGQFFGLSETEIDVGEVDLERCVTSRDDLAYCRYSIDARMSENELGPIAHMMNMGFVLTGYQWSSFVVRDGQWELDLKYDHCSLTSSRINCTRRE